MILCKDPALTFLNGLGYNVVRLPRAGILPLDVLGKERRGLPEPLGRLSTIWKTEAAEPAAKATDSAQFQGVSTSALKLSVGIKLLEAFLGALGASAPSVRLSYNGARRVKFRFDNPTVLGVAPLEIGDFLKDGDLEADSPFVRRYFFDEDNRAYVVSEVLQSSSISVSALDENELDVGVDVPAIQNAVKGELAVKVSSGTQGDITYEGKQRLTFGFKAYQIAFLNGRWDVDRVPANQKDALLGAAGQPAVADPILFAEAQLPLI